MRVRPQDFGRMPKGGKRRWEASSRGDFNSKRSGSWKSLVPWPQVKLHGGEVA